MTWPSTTRSSSSLPCVVMTWKSSGLQTVEAVRPDPVLQPVYLGAEPVGFSIGGFGKVSKTAFNRFW